MQWPQMAKNYSIFLIEGGIMRKRLKMRKYVLLKILIFSDKDCDVSIGSCSKWLQTGVATTDTLSSTAIAAITIVKIRIVNCVI